MNIEGSATTKVKPSEDNDSELKSLGFNVIFCGRGAVWAVIHRSKKIKKKSIFVFVIRSCPSTRLRAPGV